MTADRFRWLGIAGISLLLGTAALGCASGGATSTAGATDTSASPETTATTSTTATTATNIAPELDGTPGSTAATSTIAPVGITATTVDPELSVRPDLGPPASCGDVDADFVTRVLGAEARLLGVDASGCGFTAGQWTLGVRVEPYDPATNGELKTSPSLSGTSVPNQTFVTNDRSGYWFANSVFVVHDQIVTFRLVNLARGSDAYPPTEGEPQQPVTESAARRMIDRIAALSS
ncbi:MAG: hypothetical protein F2520_02930 [Actinobacteria bacterium]|uniref:Unannotated protein n=1 Tax=freshwater metagenome TaxID=449393 RepID=A0A6J5Y9K7_9ZZZZ|nr:hypothetical protein [Actinomycetota bacterium]MTA77201.1 hypothetical protein [Actinomycetota bacterium]